MTNGHWERRRAVEAEADELYRQGKTQEAEYALGMHLHPGYVTVAEREAIEKAEQAAKSKKPVSVFVEPPPQTVTVAPPGYEQPEKPDRVSVFDPSTELSQARVDPFLGQLEGVFGEPTVKAAPIVTDICPAFCKIIHVPTNIVSYEGNCSCGTMERYDSDPEYRVEVLTKQVEPEETSWYWVKYPSGRIEYMKITESLKDRWLQQGYEISRSKIEGVSVEPVLIPIPAVHVPELIPDVVPEPEVPFVPEPEVPFIPEPEPIITTDQVEPPTEIMEPEITTVDIPIPEEQPEIIVTPTPTEERPVKWIPEPFFSFINEVFKR